MDGRIDESIDPMTNTHAEQPWGASLPINQLDEYIQD